MAEQKVRVVKGRSWSGGPLGSKDDSSAPFDYDYARDPNDLKKLGLVELIEDEAPPAAAPKKA